MFADTSQAGDMEAAVRRADDAPRIEGHCMKTSLAAAAATGALLALGAGSAHAQTAADSAKLQEQIQALQAQVSALQAQVGQGPVVTNAAYAQTPGGTGPVNQSGTQCGSATSRRRAWRTSPPSASPTSSTAARSRTRSRPTTSSRWRR